MNPFARYVKYLQDVFADMLKHPHKMPKPNSEMEKYLTDPISFSDDKDVVYVEATPRAWVRLGKIIDEAEKNKQ